MANKGNKTNKKSTARGKKTSNTLKQERIETVPLKQIAKDERTHKIIGTAFLLISFFLLLSFISYFLTWRQDYTPTSRGWALLSDVDAKVDNLMGKAGALTSDLFITKLFGVASFLICTFFFVVGVNLLSKRKIFSVWKNLKYVTLGMLSVATILSFMSVLLHHQGVSWGGGVGNYLSGQLTNWLGQIGAAAVLFLILVGYFIWQFNPAFNFPKKLQPKIPHENIDTNSVTELISNEIDNKSVPPLSKSGPVTEEGAKLIIDTGNDLPKHGFTLVEKESAQHREEEKGFENISVLKPDAKAVPVDEDDSFTKPAATASLPKPSSGNLELEINEAPVGSSMEEASTTTSNSQKLKPYEPTLDLKNYKYPTLDLLEDYGTGKVELDPEELEYNKNQIINTLKNYDIEIQKIKATIGPTVTLYEIVPAAGVRISRIKNLEDDIALSLAALGIRIIAPIPGRGTIGIEVPNAKKTIVSMKSLLSSEKYQNSGFSLPIALGKKIDNENFIVDLATMPHLLMAGATGQGKSVGINAILVSLLYKKHPSQLKMILIDPKKVELSIYSHIVNHFLARLPNEADAIITDTKKVINTLNALCIEMDHRYNFLKDAGCRNIKEYNIKFISRRLNPDKGHAFMPFIVLVIDEFADLIMTAGKEIEMPIARLAQLARAVGIHLIIATQRPSVNIITGIIKANFPARVAFKVSSKIDSRTILDTGGAEQLIGKGDMLISLSGEVTRLQCAFVDTPEIDKIVEFIAFQEGFPEPFYLPEYIDEKDLESGEFDMNERDSLFEEAARVIVSNQIGSTSLLQRRMKLGYNRAGRLMDQLEAAGIVGPSQGSKARDVLIKTEVELQQHLDTIR